MTNLALKDTNNFSTETYRHLPTREVTAMVENQLQLKGVDFTRNFRRCNGTAVVVEYTITNKKYLRMVDDSCVQPKLYLFNSENKESAFKIDIGFLRLVCMNGLMVGESIFRERMIHRQGPNFETKYAAIRSKISNAIDYLDTDWHDELNETLSVGVDLDKSIQVIGNLNVPKKVKKASIESLYNPRRWEDSFGTIGCLLNIVNEEIKLLINSEAAVLNYNKNLLRDILDLSEAV